MARQTKAQQTEQQEAIDRLRAILTRGQTVYTKVDHVSRSGMLRHISVYVMAEYERAGRKECAPQNISYWVALAIGNTRAEDGGVKVGGCGMDMGFHLVYTLAATIFRDDPRVATEEEIAACPRYQGPESYYKRGGYALSQRWL